VTASSHDLPPRQVGQHRGDGRQTPKHPHDQRELSAHRIAGEYVGRDQPGEIGAVVRTGSDDSDERSAEVQREAQDLRNELGEFF
jgi:hypothetical protein